jgi:hypothetical protein
VRSPIDSSGRARRRPSDSSEEFLRATFCLRNYSPACPSAASSPAAGEAACGWQHARACSSAAKCPTSDRGLGRNEAGENSSLAMAMREGCRDGQDLVHPCFRPRTFRRKHPPHVNAEVDAALGQRKEATADRTSYVQPSTAIAAPAMRASRRQATKLQLEQEPRRRTARSSARS